jgi:hypothetical protein
MGQDKLSASSLLSIESELLKNLDIDDIITDFAHKKSRQVNIVWHVTGVIEYTLTVITN